MWGVCVGGCWGVRGWVVVWCKGEVRVGKGMRGEEGAEIVIEM